MRKVLVSVAAVLLLAVPWALPYAGRSSSVVSAQAPPPGPVTPPYVKLPATKTAKPNRYFCLRPDTNCKSIKWIVPAGRDRLDPEIPVKDTNALVLIGDAGTYTVSAYGALGDAATDIASCVVTIGTPPPGPTPTPPTPPTPTDPFTLAVQAAYAGETSPTKAADAAAMAAAFSQASGQLAGVTTYGALDSLLINAMKAITSGTLPKVEATVVAELKATWAVKTNDPLDSAAAKAELLKIAAALSTLK